MEIDLELKRDCLNKINPESFEPILYVDHSGQTVDAWLRSQAVSGAKLYYKESDSTDENGHFKQVYTHVVGVPFDKGKTPHSWHFPEANAD